VNSTLALQEEKQDTSSVEISGIPKYRIPCIPLALFQDVATTATIVFTSDTLFYNTYFITASGVDISGWYEISSTIPRIKVVYKKRESIEALLGDRGKRVLRRVIDLMEDTSRQQNWTLTHVEVTPIKDAEVESWQYILIMLVFDRDFEVADKYLHNFYGELDSLADVLDGEEQDILQGKLFFDVATTV